MDSWAPCRAITAKPGTLLRCLRLVLSAIDCEARCSYNSSFDVQSWSNRVVSIVLVSKSPCLLIVIQCSNIYSKIWFLIIFFTQMLLVLFQSLIFIEMCPRVTRLCCSGVRQTFQKCTGQLCRISSDDPCASISMILISESVHEANCGFLWEAFQQKSRYLVGGSTLQPLRLGGRLWVEQMLTLSSNFLLHGSTYFFSCVPQSLNMTGTQRSGCVIFFFFFFFFQEQRWTCWNFQLLTQRVTGYSEDRRGWKKRH